MPTRIASRPSVRWYLLVGALGAVGLVVGLVVGLAMQTPGPVRETPRITRIVPLPAPAATPCEPWVKLDVATPTRVCTEDEQGSIEASYFALLLAMDPGTRAFDRAQAVARLPLSCRPNLPSIAKVFTKGSVAAMARKAYAHAEQFSELALVYGEVFVETGRDVRKVLARERMVACQLARYR